MYSLCTNFYNTASNTQYPLYYGELKEHRKLTRGTVTLRLRVEFPDVRKALIGGMMPPPPSTVSVARRIDLDVARYTTDGLVDEDRFSLDTLARSVEELQSYLEIVEVVKEAAMVVRDSLVFSVCYVCQPQVSYLACALVFQGVALAWTLPRRD